MPFIRCDIRRGRTKEQRDNLCTRVTEIVNRITGAPVESILILVNEHAGDHWMEGGEVLPEYVAGSNAEDSTGAAALKNSS